MNRVKFLQSSLYSLTFSNVNGANFSRIRAATDLFISSALY